jgi:hypothetical protein
MIVGYASIFAILALACVLPRRRAVALTLLLALCIVTVALIILSG